jgi:hypothetical protein
MQPAGPQTAAYAAVAAMAMVVWVVQAVRREAAAGHMAPQDRRLEVSTAMVVVVVEVSTAVVLGHDVCSCDGT